MNDPYRIVHTVLITEKGTDQSNSLSKYSFRVASEATKIDIRRAVQAIFNVKVASVNVMNRQGKLKRLRSAQYGRRSSWKKAIVTLKEGKIDIL
jgi:large subunit ribosomal protein L23